MRISYASLCGGIALLASAVASFAVAAPAAPKPTAPTCGCHQSAARTVRHAVRLRRHGHAKVWRHVARWSGQGEAMDGRMMGHHMWRRAQESTESHGWSEEEGHWSHGGHWDLAWGERPWATDAYGYLTWPGKTHFVNGHAMTGDPPPPPPPPEGAGPPEGWQGPPPPPPGAAGDDEGRSFDIYRF